jgi:3-methylcrotonyl-CoA carboxylase alpha subunit
MISRLLIANRGEIARRIIRTARSMGVETVAVYSDSDRGALHVIEADHAVALGGTRPAESYLRAEAIIDAAKASGAQAVHPGYGFLSENAAFARACEQAGLIFVGPPADAIDAMGSKSAAKALMEQAGVPLVPGYHGEDQQLDCFRSEAARIGYPVLLKAAAGGGGKGMKVVEREEELEQALESAQREARAAFGDERMLVEKYLLRPRHIEIQVFADSHGHCIYLHERDCSIQRRHQKVVEEAPAPNLTAALRMAMGEAAVRAAQAIGYIGAGTVEFLLDERGDFFFMEMNTRLQVEHPVTEAITGLDLVEWQLRIAAGERLPLTQAQVPLNGHAIEVRLYAEDPVSGFLPSTGRLTLYREPAAGPGRRIDMGVAEGDDISPWYDPMLGKLIAWGSDREQARLRLLAMLAETRIAGPHTNLGFLRRILAHPAFAGAELDTGFIPRFETQLLPAQEPLPDAFWQAAANAWLQTEPPRNADADPNSPWAKLTGWRAGLPPGQALHLSCNGERRRVVPDASSSVSSPASADPIRRGDTLYLMCNSELHTLRLVDPLAESMGPASPDGGLTAPMNGSIVRVLVQPGEQVEAGTPLVVLEAMKMEHSVRAPVAGIVREVLVVEGELVSEGAVLVELDKASSVA